MEQDSKSGKGVFAKLRARATSYGSTDSQGKRVVLPLFVGKTEDKEGVENVNASINNGPKNSRDFRAPALIESPLPPSISSFSIPELGKNVRESAPDEHIPRSPTPILPNTFEVPELRYMQCSQLVDGKNASVAGSLSMKTLESAGGNFTKVFKTSDPNDLGAENVLQNSLNQPKYNMPSQKQPEHVAPTCTRKAIIGTVARPAYPMPRKREILPGQESASARTCVRTPLCDFKLDDNLPRKSRIALASLQRLDAKLRCEGRLKVLTKEFLRGKREKDRDSKAGAPDISEFDAKELKENRKSVISNSPGNALDRLGAFLKSKKGKKKTRNVMLHLLNLAIHDDRSEHACALLAMISSNTLRKKKPQEANRTFLLAMAKRMENVTLAMFEKGFPMDVNAPIFGDGPASSEARPQPQSSNEPKQNTGSSIPFAFPSFFILAVGLGLEVLVRAMIKRANLNQTWFGLTPLILATTRQGIGSPLMVNILLEHGADPGQGIWLEQLYALIRIKHGTGSMGRDTSTSLSESGLNDAHRGKESPADRGSPVLGSLSRKNSARRHSDKATNWSAESQDGESRSTVVLVKESTPLSHPVEGSSQKQKTPVTQQVVPSQEASHTLSHQNSTSRLAAAHLKIVTGIKEASQHYLIADPLPTEVDKKGFPRQVTLPADGVEERKLANVKRHGKIASVSISRKGESVVATDTNVAQTGVNDTNSSRGDGSSATQESFSPFLGFRRRLSVSVKGKIAKELDGIKAFEKRLSRSMEVKEDTQHEFGGNPVQRQIVLPVEFAAAVGNSSCVFYVLRRYESRRPLVDSQFGLLVQQNLPITAQLLNAGAPVAQREPRGSTALHLAARTNAAQILYALLAIGINCNIPGENGWTALHEAVSQKSKTAALALVEHGADLNAKTKDGDTPAMVGSKIGLTAEELQSFFDTTKIRASDQDEQKDVYRYIFDIVNETKKVPFSEYSYPPKVGGSRKRCETAPASNQMLSAAQRARGEIPVANVLAGGVNNISPTIRWKRKTAMERFGFRPRSVSGGPTTASIRDLSTMSAQTLPVAKAVSSTLQLDANHRSTSAPLRGSDSTQTIASESGLSIGEATTITRASSVSVSGDRGQIQVSDHNIPDNVT